MKKKKRKEIGLRLKELLPFPRNQFLNVRRPESRVSGRFLPQRAAGRLA
jgi:hypothetical protein